MGKGRLEAFTDGVIAIIITIMVLEIKVPPAADLAALSSTAPILLTYALSFLNIGIFWNNHHHMLHAATQVDGKVLWANLLLLFWMSLVPLVIRWIDDSGFEPLPIATYGFVLVMSALAYLLLEWAIVAANKKDSRLADAIGRELKGKVSLALYVVAIALAFVEPWIALVLYLGISLMWFVPDRRVESREKRET
jgi:uncharacterized membrane protein